MHPLLWKTLTALFFLIILAEQISHWTNSAINLSPTTAYDARPPLTDLRNGLPLEPSTMYPLQWSYDWARDRDDLALTATQCDIAFQDLYHPLERSVTYWRPRNLTANSIQLSEENEAGMRILIHAGQLRILLTRGMARPDFRERIVAVLYQLYRTLLISNTLGETVRDTEFTIAVDDIPHLPFPSNGDEDHAVWAFTRNLHEAGHEAVWLMPDFHFLAAPRAKQTFAEMQALARERDSPLEEKMQKVVWRGVRWTNEELRGAMFSAVEGKAWADVKDIDWSDKTQVMPMQSYCDYAFLLNTEGRSWTSRLLYILNCDSVPIMHDISWDAHFYHLLKPGVNYARVNTDFSNLETLVEGFIVDLDKAQKIADEAKAVFRERYVTPAATACYWRRMLRSWTEVAFVPEIYEYGANGSVGSLRGVPFEQFIFNDGNDVV